ncbi:dioxygenase [Ectothiorhodospiraceae bacterium WFHF3C12]|nr:dioxygenase [Ectothiorhodospiraceae bacterium WFHF3C12]
MSTQSALFVSHGAPTFAIEPGHAGPRLAALGRALPRPEAVLVVSPHWMTSEPRVTTTARPETIHDFGGFDPSLYDIQYPAAGHPALAERTIALLRADGWSADADSTRGLDHGAWVPLLHLYPAADVPVFQVSMPAWLDEESAYALGRSLGRLREDGVLVVGSGSLTHNLYEFRAGAADAEYAGEFAEWIARAVTAGDHDSLLRALHDAPHARRAHPTTEHYLPLLVATGAAPRATPATVIRGGTTYGVLVTDSFVFGADIPATEADTVEG